MLQQYLEIKNEYRTPYCFSPRTFVNVFEDAQIASRELEIVLTARDAGNVVSSYVGFSSFSPGLRC